MDLKFSVGEDGSKSTAETATLLENGWSLDEGQMGVKKTYYFKTYTKCQVGNYPHLYDRFR